jgi:cytochrome c-type biogenesis protein CcmH/NrfG
MGRSFYPMTPAEVVEDFSGRNEFVVQESGLHYRMLEREGKYYQRQFLVDSEGREVAADEHELRFVIGSNRHSRSYVVETEGRLYQAPACWYPEASRWDLCPGYEFKNDHFAREIAPSCLHCHNARMELRAGERNQYSQPYPHGIDCERCHGPGQLHVARWSSGHETPTGTADATIVHPRRLPPSERIEICFQCHLGDAKATERVGRHDRELGSFRPGQLLTEVVAPFRYKHSTEYEFGLSAQGDRLLLSRCYTESGGQIECLTCHNPHVTVYHPERPPGHFRQRCVGCHATEACSAPQESRQRTAGLADDCVACHMRKAPPDDQRFTEFTDHWIRRDIAIEQPDHRQSYEVVPIFPDRLAALPAGEQSYYAARAYYLLARDAPSSERAGMWQAAEQGFRTGIEAGFETADSWFFLGKTLQNLGRQPAAAEAFARAARADAAHQDAAFAHGQALVARGDLEGGLAVFQSMLARDGDNAMALAEVGRCAMALGRKADAEAAYRKALAREPGSASLYLNLARVLAQAGRMDEALTHGETATRLDPDEVEVWEFYSNANRVAGKTETANEASRILERLRRASEATGAASTVTVAESRPGP